MGRKLDLEGMWPELFEGMSYTQRRAVIDACAANWHEGWEPNYDDVKDLADYARGVITAEEYTIRTQTRIYRRHRVPVAA